MKNIFEGSTVYQEPRRNNQEVEVEKVMADVARDVETLLMKLKDNINAHKYRVVLGIDSGGRVPGLLLGSVLKEIYKNDGAVLPKTTFIAGSRASLRSQDRGSALEEYFSLPVFPAVKSEGKKILLIEDVIKTRESIQDIEEALQEASIHYDVAALSKIRSALSSKTIFANVTSTLLNRNRVMSGVHKTPDKLFSQTLRRPLYGALEAEVFDDSLEDEAGSDGGRYASDSEVLRRTRVLIKAHAHELAQKFLQDREADALARKYLGQRESREEE